MKLYLKTKNVLDERETQEMYRIEHRGMWGMYVLLCAAVVVQMLFGAGFAQIAGEAFVIAVVSVGMIIAYARRGIWDADARPSTGGNAAYALLCALGVTAVTFGLHENAAKALLFGADGLDFYRRISREAPEYLNEGGCLLFEIGWLQKDAVSALVKAHIGEPFALRDYGQNWRVVGARKEGAC